MIHFHGFFFQWFTNNVESKAPFSLHTIIQSLNMTKMTHLSQNYTRAYKNAILFNNALIEVSRPLRCATGALIPLRTCITFLYVHGVLFIITYLDAMIGS